MELDVDTDELTGLAATLDHERERLEATLDHLDQEVMRMAQQWSGASQRAFLNRYHQTAAQARHVVADLFRSAAKLRDIAQGYADLDSRAAASLNLAR